MLYQSVTWRVDVHNSGFFVGFAHRLQKKIPRERYHWKAAKRKLLEDACDLKICANHYYHSFCTVSPLMVCTRLLLYVIREIL